MLTRPPSPLGGPALAILDTVLSVAKRELAWHHPLVDDEPDPGTHEAPVDLVARLLAGRLDELRDLADAYRQALAGSREVDLF
jgi:hypothetical protein